MSINAMSWIQKVRWLIVRLWAAPVTLVGLLLTLPVIVGPYRAHFQICNGNVEVFGAKLPTWITRWSFFQRLNAITLGHVILARHGKALNACREHEQVHVQQTERWGPLFPLLYVGAGLISLARGTGWYEGNYFERQAFAVCDPRTRR